MGCWIWQNGPVWMVHHDGKVKCHSDPLPLEFPRGRDHIHAKSGAHTVLPFPGSRLGRGISLYNAHYKCDILEFVEIRLHKIFAVPVSGAAVRYWLLESFQQDAGPIGSQPLLAQPSRCIQSSEEKLLL